MKKEIVYTDKYALILSDETPIKVYYDTYIHQLKHTGGAEYGESSIAKTVVGHLPLTDDAPILEGVPLLPPLPKEDDVNKLAYEKWKKSDERSGNPPYIYRIGFNEGYNKAKEKYKYTEFDIIQAFEYGWNQRHFGKMSEDKLQQIQQTFIQSLQQPSRPTHFECETITMNKGYTDELDVPYQEIEVPKTTTNSQGQEELVGKYLNL
jgi:hypothetical protein